ncbi:MAG: alpha/beta fold hydrolase [Anaerolineales bacterium]
MPKAGLTLPLFAVVSLLACTTLFPERTPGAPEPTATEGGPARQDTRDILDGLGAYGCPESDFTCVKVEVPLNHFDASGGTTLEVLFAVLPATGERKGMFVTVVGGPGGSGLAVADSYTGTFDASIPENFDIVFFDQRGVAGSGGLQCVEAASTYYQTEADTTTPEGEADLLTAAQTFADACASEMGSSGLLPYLGTEQAVEDLEVFRQIMQEEQFWLYGESYGTQFVQTYAAAYPDRLAALLLDGPVDLTRTGIEYYVEQAEAFDGVLGMTLDACTLDVNCSADLKGDAAAEYDRLAALLAAAPIPFDFPLPDGTTEQRSFSLGDLQSAAVSYLYSETARMIYLRGLAAASRGDWVPLAHVLYDALSLDPVSLEAIVDPGWSDAVFYGVECNDYDYGPAEEYLRAGDPVDVALHRLGGVFYGDLPCAFWPEDGFDPGRPAPLVAEGIPTLVMVGTADPATPIGNARRIVSHLADGYLVVEEGGPHVIFGWGNACVDDLVTDFLVDDQLPDRETTCDGVVIADYASLAPLDSADYANPLEALASVDTEIFYTPEYYYWDLVTPTSLGCPRGGSLLVESSGVGEDLRLTECAFSEGFVMTGTGEYDYDSGVFRLDVSVTGYAVGELVYERENDGSIHVRGTFGGEAVDLSD